MAKFDHEWIRGIERGLASSETDQIMTLSRLSALARSWEGRVSARAEFQCRFGEPRRFGIMQGRLNALARSSEGEDEFLSSRRRLGADRLRTHAASIANKFTRPAAASFEQAGNIANAAQAAVEGEQGQAQERPRGRGVHGRPAERG